VAIKATRQIHTETVLEHMFLREHGVSSVLVYSKQKL